MCRHCKDRKSSPPRRGLCWSCRTDPAVQALYPSTSKFARRGAPSVSRSPLPAVPTRTRPGSEERIRVLAERAARGEALFRPDDAGWG